MQHLREMLLRNCSGLINVAIDAPELQHVELKSARETFGTPSEELLRFEVCFARRFMALSRSVQESRQQTRNDQSSEMKQLRYA